MKSISFVLCLLLPQLVLGMVQLAYSAPPEACHCEQYKGLTAFASLADEVATLGSAAAHPADGSILENHEAEVAALRLRITSNDLIPAECKKQLLHELTRPRVTAFARLIAGGNGAQAAPDSAQADKLFNSYGGAYSQTLWNSYNQRCSSNQTTQCFNGAAQAAWTQFGQALSSDPAQLGLGASSADELKIMKAYYSVLSAGSEAALLANIKAGKDGLNDKQFLTLVQMVGQQLGNDYDNSRSGAALDAKGIVSGDQLLSVARLNTQYGLGISAGVCRDIMTLQAKMLEAHGMPNTYVMSYGLPGNYHTIAITGDRSDPTLYHAFSYDLRTDNAGLDGGIALFQRGSVNSVGLPDSSLNYIISKPEGEVVGFVPSEMEKFLQEASGFDIRQMDPLARETSSMLGSGITFTSDSGRTSATTRVVAGQDGIGAQYAGVAETVNYAQGTLAPGRVGIFVGDQHRPGSIYGTKTDENAMLAYLQLEQHFMTPALKLGKSTTLTVDNSLTFAAMGGMIVDGDDKTDGVFGGDLRLKSEVRVDQSLAGGRLHSIYRAGVEATPGVRDVRDMNFGGDLTLSLNSVYAGTTQTLKVNDLTLFGNVTAAVDLMGSRGLAEVGVAGGKWATSAYVAGRLSGSVYEDNTIRRVGVSATYRPVKYVQVGLVGEMPIEGDAPLTQAHLMGSAIVNF